MDKYVDEFRQKQKQKQIPLELTAKSLRLHNFTGHNLAIKDKLVKSSDPYIKIAVVTSKFKYEQGKGAMASKNGLASKDPSIKFFAKSKVIYIKKKN